MHQGCKTPPDRERLGIHPCDPAHWERCEGPKRGGPLCDLTDAFSPALRRGHTTSSRYCVCGPCWTPLSANHVGVLSGLALCVAPVRFTGGRKPANACLHCNFPRTRGTQTRDLPTPAKHFGLRRCLFWIISIQTIGPTALGNITDPRRAAQPHPSPKSVALTPSADTIGQNGGCWILTHQCLDNVCDTFSAMDRAY